MEALKGILLAANPRDDELAQIAVGGAHHSLPVANKPLLAYGIEAMEACGIADIAVVVTPETAPGVREVLGDGRLYGVRVGYLEVPRPPTLVDALLATSSFVGDQPFLVHLGDGLVAQPLKPIVDEFCDSEIDALLLVRNDAEQGSEGDLFERRHGLRLVQDRPIPPAEQSLAGVYAFRPSVIRAAGTVQGRRISEVIDAVAEQGGRIETRLIRGSWKYSGDVDGLLEANRIVLDEISTDLGHADLSAARIEGRVEIHSTAVVERSTIRGPAVIGPGAVVVDAFIGPYTAVGTGVRLEGAEIEHSIVMDNALIRHLGKRLEDSLVGQEAVVTREFGLPAALRLRVGSRAEVSLA